MAEIPAAHCAYTEVKNLVSMQGQPLKGDALLFT